jgi:hypothetical protein
LLIPNLLFKIKKKKRAAELAVANTETCLQNRRKKIKRQSLVANTELVFSK